MHDDDGEIIALLLDAGAAFRHALHALYATAVLALFHLVREVHAFHAAERGDIVIHRVYREGEGENSIAQSFCDYV